MRKSKGKWIASVRDTWSLDYTISPIIHAGLKKFKEELEKAKYSGVPSDFVSDNNEVTEQNVKDWHNVLDKMAYAFDINSEPDSKDFNFKTEMLFGEKTDRGTTPVEIVVDNEEEKERYYEVLKEHRNKCTEGRMLFAKYYESLWI